MFEISNTPDGDVTVVVTDRSGNNEDVTVPVTDGIGLLNDYIPGDDLVDFGVADATVTLR